MRHRVYGKHLGRDKNQRTALFKGIVRSLILHESIQTTESKAKATKGLVDRVISKSKEGSNASKNFIKSILPHEEVIKKLMEDIAPRYKDRDSGFTSIVKLGSRLGDGATIVRMSLVGDKKEKVKAGEKVGKEESRVESQESSEKKAEEKVENKKSKKTAKKEAKS